MSGPVQAPTPAVPVLRTERPRLRGFGVWAVEERETGRFIGRVGCFHPEGWPGFEIAYTLARPAWGRGFAREAAAASLAYARETLRRTSIISVIRPGNAASIRVATSLGAVRDGSVDFYGGAADSYRYPDVPLVPRSRSRGA